MWRENGDGLRVENKGRATVAATRERGRRGRQRKKEKMRTKSCEGGKEEGEWEEVERRRVEGDEGDLTRKGSGRAG